MQPGIRLPAAGLALLLVGGGCSSSPVRPIADPLPPSTTTRPDSALWQGITATATALDRIQDDLDGNGDLTVPQNRYNEDIEKFAVAVVKAETPEASASLSASQADDVHRLLADAPVLVAALRHSPHDARTPLQTVRSDIAVLRQDRVFGD